MRYVALRCAACVLRDQHFHVSDVSLSAPRPNQFSQSCLQAKIKHFVRFPKKALRCGAFRSLSLSLCSQFGPCLSPSSTSTPSLKSIQPSLVGSTSPSDGECNHPRSSLDSRHKSTVPHREARPSTDLRIPLLERTLLRPLRIYDPTTRSQLAPHWRPHRPSASFALPMLATEAPANPTRTRDHQGLPRRTRFQVPPCAHRFLHPPHVQVNRHLPPTRTTFGRW